MRIWFPNNAIATITNMAEQGVLIVDKTIQKEMGGIVDYEEDFWYILLSQNNLKSQGYGIIEKIKKITSFLWF